MHGPARVLGQTRRMTSSAPAAPAAPHGFALWLAGARPRTLPAAIVPVLVGTACAVRDDGGDVRGIVVWRALAALVVSDPNPNPSLGAIGERYDRDPGWPATATVPFSSARKWAAADFGEHGCWYLGAPDILLARAPADRGIRPSTRAIRGGRCCRRAAVPS